MFKRIVAFFKKLFGVAEARVENTVTIGDVAPTPVTSDSVLNNSTSTVPSVSATPIADSTSTVTAQKTSKPAWKND